ncbi:hypothetical protein HHI36_021803 [Cryptolaemus montrouzieri]|uniref:Glucose-methanol-choline oxidoreductase N-terminal domain-containing protein n=1 Tax=Cryptolaemus montrouzieri TaxID=559131 RepID=A0ABD2MY61_9CUCU
MNGYGLYQDQSISCPGAFTGDAGVFFLALINTLFTKQCELGNKDNYPIDAGPSLVDNDSFDYIVVGGGTAGSVVASKLAKSTQNRVLLLEAGGYPSPTSDIPAFHLSLQKTIEDWQFHTEKSNKSCLGLKNGKCLWPMGKTLGGSSTINSMLYTRGSKHIFNSWAEKGTIGWSYQEVFPYFKMSEKLEVHELISSKQYGIDGILPLTRSRLHQPLRTTIFDSAKELGYKVSSHETGVGFFEALQTIKNGVRKNTAKVFLADHKILPNLQVATEALVEKIIIDRDLKIANGVKVDIGGSTLNLYAEKEVIVSAGPVNSPKLLMLSGIGPKEYLGSLGIETVHDINVGQNLQDHFMYPVLAVKVNDSAIKYFAQNPIEELYKYFANREGLLAYTGISNIVGFLNTKNHSGDANIKLNYMLVPREDSYFLPQFTKDLNFVDEVKNSLYEANKDSHLLVICVTLMDTKSKGKILLKSKNPHDKPLIYPGYLSDEKDLDLLLKGIRLAEKQIETRSFKKVSADLIYIDIPNCRKYKFRTDDYWKCAIRNVGTSGYNPVGTCRMGLSIDPNSIVNPLLKVHGIEKLRVIDSSVLPTSTRADVLAAAIMIGQKGAQLVINGYETIKNEFSTLK